MRVVITAVVIFLQIIGTYFLFFFGSAFIFSVLFPSLAIVDNGYGPAIAAVIAVFGIGAVASLLRGGLHGGRWVVRLLGTFVGALLGYLIVLLGVTGILPFFLSAILAVIGYYLIVRLI